MKIVEIYTDGACSGNPGIGGYAGILLYKGKSKIVCGGEKLTTNNRMELLAVINSLKALTEKCEVLLYSDSAYVVNAINNGWIYNWVKNDFKKSENSEQDIKNVDLWMDLYSILKHHKITFIKVKGHSDNEMNNKCDEIARGEIVKIKETL